MKLSFKRNLLIGFGISLFLLIISSVASYTSIRTLLESARWVDHTHEVLQEVEQSLSYLKDAETQQRGYLLTDDQVFLPPYRSAADSAKMSIDRVQKLTVDNDVQQINCNNLRLAVNKRLELLEHHINERIAGKELNITGLMEGRKYMVEARTLIKKMEDEELRLLDLRTGKMNKFAAFTPPLVMIAALLGIIITIVSFVRVNSDYEKNAKLQQALQEKDEDITRRINIIQDVANKISAGDYGIRVGDEGTDGLGSLSFSLNKMAGSLQYSFGQLSDKEWLQTGIAGLNDKMLGEYDLSTVVRSITRFVAEYTGSQVAAFYLAESNSFLRYVNGFAFAPREGSDHIGFGEGLAGQAAQTGQMIHLKDVPADLILISHATGAVKPNNIISIPVFFERSVAGVLELASIKAYTENELAYLQAISHNIGTVINGVQNRKKLQELLEETQSQAEELQAQHNELENINEELEAQTEKLQASEEELRVQQEELMEANQALEEKARLLEEKNQLVFERNLDIQKKAEELAQSTRYKSEFLANMSHELRTPLNSILLLSRLLTENNEKNLNKEQIEYAKVILGSGQGLLSLIDEILDLSKIEAGKMDLVYAETSVQEILGEMKSLFEPIAKEKGIEFRVNVEGGAPSGIETDKARLEQVIKNLIANALKFTSKGYVELSVSSPKDQPGIISFAVKDTGIGIAADKQGVIFEAFRQADGSTRRKYGGTGLGLSISRELAKLLGGSIQLTSELNEGSTFTINIPVSKQAISSPASQISSIAAAVHEEPVMTYKGEGVRRFTTDIIPQNVPDDRATINPGDKVILIVEDDTNFAKSLLEYTRQRNYKGVVSVRGDEAIMLARRYKPLGVLLDIQLPVKDGWEVMEELKNDPSTKHIPVHLMSSYNGRYKALSKGAVDFINKPVAFEQMHEIFEKIEYVLNYGSKKVLIVEENTKHAQALAYYLEAFQVKAEIKNTVKDSIDALASKEVGCVIMDMGVPGQKAYDTLEEVKTTPGLENTPIIIFTGASLSRAEEVKIKQYANSIVIKTANSYQRILDEVSLFLHLVDGDTHDTPRQSKNLGMLREVLKDKTVLIADDDIRNIYALTKSLETFNMNVISATDGKEALKQLKENPKVDIVLMDMMMPEMDGYESTRQIKAIPKFRNLPVIAVTAKAMTGDREKCISAGASDYITKPVDVDQLLSLLRVWLYDAVK